FQPSHQFRPGRKNICVRRCSFSSTAGSSRSPPYCLSAGCEEIVLLLQKCARQLEWPTPFFLDLAIIGHSNILPGPCRFGSFFAGGSRFRQCLSPADISMPYIGRSAEMDGCSESGTFLDIQICPCLFLRFEI